MSELSNGATHETITFVPTFLVVTVDICEGTPEAAIVAIALYAPHP